MAQRKSIRRAIWILACIVMAWLLFGMLRGPIQKISIPVEKVCGLTIESVGSYRHLGVKVSPELARVCAQEVNALSCSPPRACLKPPHHGDRLVFTDKNGVPIAHFTVNSASYIVVTIPGEHPVYVAYEPVPTIGRLFSYAMCRFAFDSLVALSEKPPDTPYAEYGADRCARWLKGLYLPAASLPEIKDWAGLKKALGGLPEPTTERLTDFVDSVDAWRTPQ